MPLILRKAHAACLIFLCSYASSGNAQETFIPLHVQAQYFKKVFAYSRTISNLSNPAIVIIASSDDFGLKMKAAFEKVGITNTTVLTVKEFSSDKQEYEVAYVCPRVEIDAVEKQFVSRKILSISGVKGFYEEGRISIALNLVKDQCQILFNLDRVKSEGQRFAAEFLNIIKKR